MRKRFSYANVTATLALVFAMSGGALAAHHYLVSSTKQISPKVLKALKGKVGPAGPAGAKGEGGAKGETGAKGEPGAKGETGPSHTYFAELLFGNATVSVPAGNYVVAGDGYAYAEVAAGELECHILAGAAEKDYQYTSISNLGGELEGKKFGLAGLANNAAVTMESAGKITEVCEEAPESLHETKIVRTAVTATLVAAIN